MNCLIRTLTCVCINLFVQALVVHYSNASEYERSVKLPSLLIESKDFVQLLKSVDLMIERANKQSHESLLPPKRHVTLAIGDRSWKFDTLNLEKEISSMPDVLTDIRVRYDAYGGDISSFSLYLSDSLREVNASGGEPLVVDPIIDHVTASLVPHATWLGGGLLRSMVIAILGYLALLLVCGAISGTDFHYKFRITVGFLALLIGVIIFLAPLDEWLAGFLLVSKHASWFQRYSAEIGAFGVFIGLLSLLPLMRNMNQDKAADTELASKEKPKRKPKVS